MLIGYSECVVGTRFGHMVAVVVSDGLYGASNGLCRLLLLVLMCLYGELLGSSFWF